MKLSTKIAQGTDNGTQIRFGGKGLPIMNTQAFGNMIGIVKLKVPKLLNNDEIELLKSNQEKFNLYAADASCDGTFKSCL